jgi:hypothetical protein
MHFRHAGESGHGVVEGSDLSAANGQGWPLREKSGAVT